MQLRRSLVARAPERLLVLSLAILFAAHTDAAEKLVDTSPDGKYAMRIRFDKELNDGMVANESNAEPANHGLHSETIEEVEIVSVAGDQKLARLMPEDTGSHFTGLSLLWSSDSKWCAFYYAHPRHSYTTVYQFNGKAFRAIAKREKLLLKHKIDVRNEYIEPILWSKPGVLVLRQQTIGREGDDGADGLDCKLTRQISASGGVKLLSKKCYDDIEKAEKEFEKLRQRDGG